MSTNVAIKDIVNHIDGLPDGCVAYLHRTTGECVLITNDDIFPHNKDRK